MSRVITFSRTFPAYHQKAGQPTHFVEKLWNSLPMMVIPYNKLKSMNPDRPRTVHDFWETILDGYMELIPKYHTIRAGNRWKAGDKFSPRVWSGKPYHSKQVTIGPDITIAKVWNIEVDEDLCIWVYGGDETDDTILERLALNDGLSLEDLRGWFAKPMIGQILCWNPNIEY